MWNAIVFFTFFVGLLLLWILPLFAVGIVLLLRGVHGAIGRVHRAIATGR